LQHIGGPQRIECRELEQPTELLAGMPFLRADMPVPLKFCQEALDPPRQADGTHRIGDRCRFARHAVVLQPLGEWAVEGGHHWMFIVAQPP